MWFVMENKIVNMNNISSVEIQSTGFSIGGIGFASVM